MKKINVDNSWENYEWSIGKKKKPLNELNTVHINGSIYPVIQVEIVNDYWDMGHHYSVNTITYKIPRVFEGYEYSVDIYDIINSGIDVYKVD